MVFSACHREGHVNYNLVKTPNSKFIDINEDGQNEFQIKYQQTETLDIPVSNANITGEIHTLHGEAFLCSPTEGCMFLKAGDTISLNDSANTWNFYGANVITRSWHRGKWEKSWEPLTNLTDNYKLAFKMMDNNQEKIGYMTLGLDKKTGEIEVLNTTISELGSLVIN